MSVPRAECEGSPFLATAWIRRGPDRRENGDDPWETTMVDDGVTAAIPDVREWMSSFGLSAFDAQLFVRTAPVRVSHALATASLLWPGFVEHRGCVIVESRFNEANVDRWLKQLDGDRGAVESVINHVHLWDVFDDTDEAEDDGLAELVRVMERTWRAAASARFPDRRFTTWSDDGTNEYGPTVSIHTER